jgi:hypothetical protein
MSTGSTIKTTVTSTVTLGSAAYLSPLTITRMGGVRVAGFGDTGIYVPAALTGGSILNDGHVYGANGPSVEFFRVDGGIGMDIEGQATLASYGIIVGGAGGSSLNTTDPGLGGDGLIVRAGSSITNKGDIYGGAGGYSHFYAAPGGTGMLDDGAAKFTNAGVILGGAGGESGATGGEGGIGLYLTGGATATSSGVIGGGQGGYSVERYGGGAYHAAGGYGVLLTNGAKLTNTGIVTGGAGGGTKGFTGGGGGGGAFLYGGMLVNSGNIEGGGGGLQQAGGVGVLVDVLATGTSVLDNTGTITGGDGGPELFSGDAAGGAGVYLFAGTLINAGTILGGLGGNFGLTRADAVQFGPNAATLVVDPGAVFMGGVYANSNVADVLELAGKSNKVLTGIGYGFDGFNDISFASGASWTIEGLAAGFDDGQKITGFTSADKIKIEDAAAASGTVKVNANGKVTIKAGGETYVLDIAGAKKGSKDFKFSNDTLSEKSTGAATMNFIAPPAAAEPTATAALPEFHNESVPVSQLNVSRPASLGWTPLDLKSIDYGGVMAAVTLAGGGL